MVVAALKEIIWVTIGGRSLKRFTPWRVRFSKQPENKLCACLKITFFGRIKLTGEGTLLMKNSILLK